MKKAGMGPARQSTPDKDRVQVHAAVERTFLGRMDLAVTRYGRSDAR